MNRFAELSEAAGGKWFLRAQPLLLSIPFTVTTSILTTGLADSGQIPDAAVLLGQYAKLLLANVVSLGICAILILGLSSALKNRSIKPINLLMVFAIGALVGAVKGFVMGATSWALGAESDLQLAITSRLIQTTMLGMWLLPSLAVVASVIEKYKSERDSLVAERVQAALSSGDASISDENLETLRNFVAYARSQFAKSNSDMAQAIRTLVQDELRPLSHKIWAAENQKIGNYSIRTTLTMSLRNFPFPSRAVAISYFVGSVPVLLKYVSFTESLIRSAAAALTILILFQIAKHIDRIFRRFTISIVASTTLIAAVMVYLVGDKLFTPIPQYVAGVTITALWVWIMQLTLVCSAFLGIRKSRDEIRDELARLNDSTPFDRAVSLARHRLLNRNFANFLHGQVQNKLLSVALRLEATDLSIEERRDAANIVDEVLKFAEQDFIASSSIDLKSGLDSLVEQWRGFIHVDYFLPKTWTSIPRQHQEILVQIADEAVSNSVRHGLAKNVKLSLEKAQDGLLLTATDDGVGPRAGQSGLGSQLFGSISKQPWTLEHLPSGGTRLSIRI